MRKDYKLYASRSDQALDVLGLSWLRFWRRPSYRTFSALDGIDLEVGRGERVGIVGRNGAGKTTLLKLVTGNFAPTDGTVEVDGQVQALMQTGLGFHGEFTGRENIRSSLIYKGLMGDALDAATEDIIDFCELGEFLDQPVTTYSLGMRSRLQFAAATAIEPDIVVIDEVLGAGDAYFTGKSNERIRQMTRRGATLLIVSHSMDQIIQFADRAIWMDRGRIILTGEPLDVVNRYEEFIHKVERIEQNGEHEGAMAQIPQWILEKKSEMGRGADWGGQGPLQITRVGVLDAAGEETNSVESGRPFGFLADIESAAEGDYPCSCIFVLYNEQGEVVTRVCEPQRSYRFPGAPQRTVAWFDDNPVGQGKYVLSAGLYRDFDSTRPNEAFRYHILSRGLRLSVSAADRDVSRVRMRPAWQSLEGRDSTLPAPGGR